eukprot:CAMPEP_0117425624 /NCGR_PEP_ID=MMETSP0758-20121206/5872_1 /TAXON_ID=63605 /ORGANISM="Percolomonas cosmopolitus, Strain AE-1 (ATCC 50343)" /LENGTH=376 /DNA_ID=CAMNT_0005210247 /DNA_START=39 /DNA_END=1172 /DNA_ORIENTATION=+
MRSSKEAQKEKLMQILREKEEANKKYGNTNIPLTSTTTRPNTHTTRTGIPQEGVMTKAPFGLKKTTTKKVEYEKNKHPLEPKREIFGPENMKKWKESKSYKFIMSFIERLSEAALQKTLTELKQQTHPVIDRVYEVLDKIEKVIDECPLVESKSLFRYGNIAFRDFMKKVGERMPDYMTTILGKDSTKEHQYEIGWYFKHAFGNATRIDYGTGHELLFLSMEGCLALGGYVTINEAPALVALFDRYIQLTRKLQTHYKLEPAGSHGVWGLDDFCFLPYIFGAAQLVNHPSITTGDIHNAGVRHQHQSEYMYLASIDYIHQVKRGPFGEHSSLLNDISAVPTWKKTNRGLIRMYVDEVMDKHVVVQHFCFGTLLRFA